MAKYQALGKDEDTSSELGHKEWSNMGILGKATPDSKQRRDTGRTSLVWILTIVAFVLLTTNIALLLFLATTQHDWQEVLAHAFAKGLSSQQNSLDSDRRYKMFNEAFTLSGTDTASIEAWDELMATGGPNGNRYIERGLVWTYYNGTQRIPYSVSMWHGLHCLNMLHRRLFTSHEEWEAFSAGFGPSPEFKHTGHLPHCFGYLAQHILCAGDTTLEKPALEWGGDKGETLMRVGVSGFGTNHQCRNLEDAHKIVGKIMERNELLPPLQWNKGDTLESAYSYLLQ